jgi:dephospho-CoA kinase
MLIIALTGGIGSGKSTVASRFAERGIPVIDTDVIARELVQKGQPALAEIIAKFGTGMLRADGELDRIKLRELVFHDTQQRSQLEAILHPRILAAVKIALAGLHAPYCILVIPLLVETKQHYPHDRVVVVDTTPELQLQRLQARDQISNDLAQQILAAQASREQRLAIANDVITNIAATTELIAQVDALHAKYLKLAGSPLP